jgi:hypothetical protein
MCEVSSSIHCGVVNVHVTRELGGGTKGGERDSLRLHHRPTRTHDTHSLVTRILLLLPFPPIAGRRLYSLCMSSSYATTSSFSSQFRHHNLLSKHPALAFPSFYPIPPQLLSSIPSLDLHAPRSHSSTTQQRISHP